MILCSRVDLRQVGKRALESLIRVGAMDSFGQRRALLEVMDRCMAVSTSHFRAISAGQMTFFGTIQGVSDEIYLPVPVILIFENNCNGKKSCWDYIFLITPYPPICPF